MKKNTSLTDAEISRFHNALSEWYAAHGRRDLPWRKTDDAYAIYISETMLQQTQVQTVLSRFYFPFLERFPSLAVLAAASQDEVLKQWEGLGYYSRARNLHETAKRLSAGNVMPDSFDALIVLPGIGCNTAHAVLAFGHHKPFPVMEANVKRVLCRAFALEFPQDKELWELAFHLLNEQDPFNYNQAMMDVGAMVCTKRKPACAICPLTSFCKGKAAPEAYPAKVAKKAVPERFAHLLVIQDGEGKLYLPRRETRFLNGLRHFPEAEHEVFYFMNVAYTVQKQPVMGDVTQTYSHFKRMGRVRIIKLDETMDGEDWFALHQVKNAALSGIDAKVFQLVQQAAFTQPAP